MKKVLLILMALNLALFGFVSCSDDDSSDNTAMKLALLQSQKKKVEIQQIKIENTEDNFGRVADSIVPDNPVACEGLTISIEDGYVIINCPDQYFHENNYGLIVKYKDVKIADIWITAIKDNNKITVSYEINKKSFYGDLVCDIFTNSVRISALLPSDVTSIVIPDTIEGKPVTQLEDKVFEDCKLLESITLPKNLTELGAKTFARCTSLKSIVIPDGVKHIKYWDFYECTSLESVTFPNQYTLTISNMAFYGCNSLTEIVIPDTIYEIVLDGSQTFAGCNLSASTRQKLKKYKIYD